MRDLTNAELEIRVSNTIAFWALIIISALSNIPAVKIASALFACFTLAVGIYSEYLQEKTRKEN